MSPSAKQTIVGNIDPEVLAFTVGRDLDLDRHLLTADCAGTAAHVLMLAKCRCPGPVLTTAESKRVIRVLAGIVREAGEKEFLIRSEDQDVHLAVERILTSKLGDTGRKVHTARSRNDQVAVDLRLYAKDRLLSLIDEISVLAGTLTDFAWRHRHEPMVGRTHLQPAMPSSVGLWASSYAEGLMDDVRLMEAAYELNDACPLGSAAGYGVPVRIDRCMVSRLLGFREPIHNVLHAANSRGKCESVILDACAQVMLTVGRLAQDMILYSMPEFGYFALPAEYCTGSSIMPQKRNPDVLELVRAKAGAVQGCADAVYAILRSLPGGYNRDLQETKGPFLEGMALTNGSLRILTRVVQKLGINRNALRAGFVPEVYAADRALELVLGGMPFRKAYGEVKDNLASLEKTDPVAAMKKRNHLGAPLGLDFSKYRTRISRVRKSVKTRKADFYKHLSRVLGLPVRSV
jgi:argininosuccinate lyase